MTGFATFPRTLTQAAIIGRVIDPRGSLPVAGAAVAMKSMPAAFARTLSLKALSHGDRWAKLAVRPDRAVTAADGCFRFVDLPDGDYTVEISPRDGGRRFGVAQCQFKVTRGQGGRIAPASAVISLPPTAVRGKIQGRLAPERKNDKPALVALPLASAEVVETRERAYADASGDFYLTDIELGKRKIEVRASGYQAATTVVVVTRGKITEMGSLVLNPSS